MNRIAWPAVFAIFGVLILGHGAFQYQTDADRRDYGALLKINPPADAVELNFERSFPSAEQEEAGHYLIQPQAFIMDARGILYISDCKDHVVYRYDSAGGFLGQFGRQGQGPGDLLLPSQMQVLDKEIAVNEQGNMRIQYFSLEGKPLRSVRRSRDYGDLEILIDGRIVGAPGGVEPHQETKLLDVVSPDGKITRSFGEPVSFKYHQSNMNRRKIVVNANREIFLFFNHLAIVRKYSLDGRLLWEKPIVTPFSRAKEQINRRANSYLPDNQPGYYGIIRTVTIFNGQFYLADQVGSRLWIWEMDENLSILRTYFVETEDIVYVSDMIPIKDGDRMTFFILGYKEDEGPQIHLLVPRN